MIINKSGVESILWQKYPEINDELIAVEACIRSNIKSRNKLLSETVNELVGAGGKRLRPAFVLLSSHFGNYDREKTVSAAGALEILHTATLVHDDIIDQAETRRGRKTVSHQYGVDMAIYTGDFLFTKAVLMLSKGIPADKLDLVAKAIKTICEGEVDQYQGRFQTDTSVLSYLKRISRKTAVLFGAACALGASVAECPEPMVKRLGRLGFCYGMAFQIRDDLNDFISESGIQGKPVGNDVSKGVITLPVIYAMRKNKNISGMLNNMMLNKEKISYKDTRYIMDLVQEHGAIEDSKALLGKYTAKGLEILESLPDIKEKGIFAKLLNDLRI